MPSRQFCTTRRTGLRNSSIGVPMVTITGPPVEIRSGAWVNTSRLAASALASTASAPSSMKGRRPACSVFNVSWLRSLTLTRKPASASASTSGMPTWPAPPTTVMSAFSIVVGASGVAMAGRMVMR